MTQAANTGRSWRRVVIAGPDLDRRAEVATAVVDAVRRGFPVVEHVRCPKPRRSGRPQGKVGAILQVLRAAFRYWRTQQRRGRPPLDGGGVLVIEGSWFDLLLHPRQHGLRHSVIDLGRFLAMVVPRVDLLVIVDASSSPPPRPGAASPDWGPWAWGQYAGWLARQKVEETRLADGGADAIGRAAVECLRSEPARDALRWAQAPFRRPARDVRATIGPEGATAAALPGSTTRAGRVVLATNQAMLARGLAAPTAAPVDDLVELCAEIGVDAGGLAAFSSPERGRIMVAVAREGMKAVLKIGARDDAGLRREGEALERIQPPGRSFEVPKLLWKGAWGDHFVLAMVAIEHRGMPPATADDVADLCVSLYGADGAGGPVIHGDLAPWNLLATDNGLVVADWEHARFEPDPMTDLTHFVVQDGIRRRHDPVWVASQLAAPGSPGWRYLEAIGVPPEQAAELARRYLVGSNAYGEYAKRVVTALVPATRPQGMGAPRL